MLYRSEGFLNGIFHPCALWVRGLTRLELSVRRRRRRRLRGRRHVEIQVDILAGNYIQYYFNLEFSNWILTHMKALRILIPGFYTEFQAGSI